MIRDPRRRGEALAEFFRRVEPNLHADLVDAGLLPSAGHDDAARARDEWRCFALYACVRGLVAAGGFNRETAAAIDALHERILLDSAKAAPGAPLDAPALEAHRERLARRYAEYGGIGETGGAPGGASSGAASGAAVAATVTRRLGEAAARHIAGTESPPAGLAEMVGALHEALAEGAAEAVRRAEAT